MTREVKGDGQTVMVVGQAGMDTRTPVWRRHVTGAAMHGEDVVHGLAWAGCTQGAGERWGWHASHGAV